MHPCCSLLQARQIGQQQRRLTVWPPFVFSSEEHHGRIALVSQCQQRSEIGVGRNHDAYFLLGALENLVIGSGLHAVIADVYGVVPVFPQLLDDDWGQRVVHEEFHGTVKGSWRSRTASAA
jgi:hypothetical protein